MPSSYLYPGSAYCCLQLQPAEATYPIRARNSASLLIVGLSVTANCQLYPVNWLKFYSTQNDWTLNLASSVGTQTPSAACLAAVQRLWSKAFVGGLVDSHPTLSAFVVRPNKINYVFLRCIAGARLYGHEWTIKIVFMFCANDKLL